jgi:hypothetical protein
VTRVPSACSVALGESSTPPVGLSVLYRSPDMKGGHTTVMADRDAAIAWELNRLIEGG